MLDLPQIASMRRMIVCLVLILAPPVLFGQSPTPDLYEGMSISPESVVTSLVPASSQPKEVRPKAAQPTEAAAANPEAQPGKSAPEKAGPEPITTTLEVSDLPVRNFTFESVPVPPREIQGCQLDKIIPRTSKRQQEFVQNVNRITATEGLLHERLNKEGKPKEHERRKFNYVVVIQDVKPGQLILDEYRNGNAGNYGFPGDIATMGMPALALVFHPYHRDEFEMSCEGLTTWHDRQVWQIHFSQRKDKPARMSTLRVEGRSYPVLLMGTAMIDTETFQIVHLETDLLQPIPAVRLVQEHQVLDYGPVRFEGRNVSLWLPQEADILLDSGGKRFHHLHTFSDYQIFSVDYGEKIGDPKTEVNSKEPAKPSM